MRKITSVVAASIAATLGLIVITASPASATANSQCPDNKVCLYDGLGWNSGLSGSADLWSDITASQADLRRYFWRNGGGAITTQSVQDDISSIKNRTDCFIYLYSDINYNNGGNAELVLTPDMYLGNLSAWEDMNNKITSIRFDCDFS